MLEQLNTANINIDAVRILCFNGLVEDCRGLRSTVWKLILYYFPSDTSQWTITMEDKLKEYNTFRENYIPTLIPVDLSGDKEKLWEDVEKDIRRTRSDVAFFIEPIDKTITVDPGFLYELSQFKKMELTKEQQDNYVYTHADILGRILYIYGCRHPEIRYVQGMNEVLAVIYYVFAKDCISGYEKYIESDAYFSFKNMMEELKDSFNMEADITSKGIRAKLKDIENVIKRNRKDLWEIFQNNSIDINIFAIRWQMLLLCQDFLMPDVVRLWDSLLSDMVRFTFFSYTCLALVVNVEKKILKGGFDEIVSAIRKSPENIEMKNLIKLAKELLDKDVKEFILPEP
jgi:transcription termination factor NusB